MKVIAIKSNYNEEVMLRTKKHLFFISVKLKEISVTSSHFDQLWEWDQYHKCICRNANGKCVGLWFFFFLIFSHSYKRMITDPSSLGKPAPKSFLIVILGARASKTQSTISGEPRGGEALRAGNGSSGFPCSSVCRELCAGPTQSRWDSSPQVPG